MRLNKRWRRKGHQKNPSGESLHREIAATPLFCKCLPLAKTLPALYHPAMKRNDLPSGPGPAPLQTDKKTLRSTLRARRKSLSPKQRESLSLAAQNTILTSAEWKRAQSVALYMAMPEEADTALLLCAAWDTGKHVQLPFCFPQEKGRMEFYACSGMHELKPGPFGILEPDLSLIIAKQAAEEDDACTPGNNPVPGAISKTSPVCLASGNCEENIFAVPAPPPDLIVVPGVAFDLRGHRLGMGGGYYDRLFARPEYAKSTRIGLAFDFQLVNFLPGEDWDLPIHALSTERGLLWMQTP